MIPTEEYGYDFPREVFHEEIGKPGKVYVVLPIPATGEQVVVERSLWNSLTNEEKIAYHRDLNNSFKKEQQ